MLRDPPLDIPRQDYLSRHRRGSRYYFCSLQQLLLQYQHRLPRPSLPVGSDAVLKRLCRMKSREESSLSLPAHVDLKFDGLWVCLIHDFQMRKRGLKFLLDDLLVLKAQKRGERHLDRNGAMDSTPLADLPERAHVLRLVSGLW